MCKTPSLSLFPNDAIFEEQLRTQMYQSDSLDEFCVSPPRWSSIKKQFSPVGDQVSLYYVDQLFNFLFAIMSSHYISITPLDVRA